MIEEHTFDLDNENKKDIKEALVQMATSLHSSEMLEFDNDRVYTFTFKGENKEIVKVIISVNKKYYSEFVDEDLIVIDSLVKNHYNIDIKKFSKDLKKAKFILKIAGIATTVVIASGMFVGAMNRLEENYRKEQEGIRDIASQIYSRKIDNDEIEQAKQEYIESLIESGDAIVDSYGNIIESHGRSLK